MRTSTPGQCRHMYVLVLYMYMLVLYMYVGFVTVERHMYMLVLLQFEAELHQASRHGWFYDASKQKIHFEAKLRSEIAPDKMPLRGLLVRLRKSVLIYL